MPLPLSAFSSTHRMEASSSTNQTCSGFEVIIFLREKRWPSGRRGIATRVVRHGSHGPHFSMFSKVLWGFLVYCMDVQLSTDRSSGSAPAGEGQTCLVALGLGARGQHGLQLLQ